MYVFFFFNAKPSENLNSAKKILFFSLLFIFQGSIWLHERKYPFQNDFKGKKLIILHSKSPERWISELANSAATHNISHLCIYSYCLLEILNFTYSFF